MNAVAGVAAIAVVAGGAAAFALELGGTRIDRNAVDGVGRRAPENTCL